ncbi:MAG: DUF2442 domain-containing protein [Chloracidobacterium sp.]|nr:DUF2442 domain-containing protein [Chloracidobacterium sp.]
MKPIRVIAATAIEDFVVGFEFSDGTKKDIDLEPYLRGPIFEPLRNDRSAFLEFSVGDSPTISWKNGADIDPYVLYHGLIPQWTEEDDVVVSTLETLRAEQSGGARRLPCGTLTGSESTIQ